MEVSRVELVEKNYSWGQEKIPCTFFSLTSSEQNLYNSFRARHDRLKATLNGLKDMGFNSEERKRGEEEAKQMFLELVNPYVQNQGLEASGCFTTYGGSPRETFLIMPRYLLLGDNGQSNASIEPQYLFSTENENLSCDSKLDYRPRNHNTDEKNVMYSLLEKIAEGKRQDGITFPMVYRRDFLYFASTEFAGSLMDCITDILKKVSPEEMNKLIALDIECLNQRHQGKFSKSNPQQEVSREAYEKKMQEVISFYGLSLNRNAPKQKYVF